MVFTAGGTEADNLAVKGLYWARRAADPRRRRVAGQRGRAPRRARPVEWLAEHEGAEVVLAAGRRGSAGSTPTTLRRRARATTRTSVALVTVMWANNEVGTVQPVAEIAAVAHEHGVPVHTDAVQAVGQLPVDFAASGARRDDGDRRTRSAARSASARCVLGRGVELTPLLHGGGQERDVRSGTLDVAADRRASRPRPSVAGGRAARSAPRRLAALRDELVAAVLRRGARRGRSTATPTRPAGCPGNAHFSFPGCEGDALLMLLDARGIECSTGSACSAGVAAASATCCSRWAPTTSAPAARCGSPSATPRPRPTSTRCSTAIGPVVERARGAAARPAARRLTCGSSPR